MNKKTKQQYFIYSVLVVLLLGFLYFNTPFFQGSVLGEDGYTKTASSTTVITDAWSCSYSGVRDIGFYGGGSWNAHYCDAKWYAWTWIESGTDPSAHISGITGSDISIKGATDGFIIVKQDVKNKYYKVSTSLTQIAGVTYYLIDDSSFTTIKNNELKHIVQLGTATSLGSNSLSLELYVDPLLPDITAVLINGEKTQEIDLSDWDHAYVVIRVDADGSYASPTWTISNSRYDYLFSCEKSSSEILGHITYSGGQTISLTADSKLPKISQSLTKFCDTHGAIVTTPEGSAESTIAYQTLASGDPVEIADDQTLTLFAIFDSTGLSTNCGEESYNFETKTCEDISGVVAFLREGTIDLESGTTIVESQVVCTVNGVPSGVYFPDQDACITYRESTIECEDAEKGYVYSASYDKCVRYVDSVSQCTEDDATPTYDDTGDLLCTKSVDTLVVVDPTDIDDAYCQENFGSNYEAKLNNAGTAYGCIAYEISNNYYCGSELMEEGDVCEPDDISSVTLMTQDVSEPITSTFSYVLLSVIVLLIIAVLITFRKVNRK